MAKQIVFWLIIDYKVFTLKFLLDARPRWRMVLTLYFSYLTIVDRPIYKHILPFEALKRHSGIFHTNKFRHTNKNTNIFLLLKYSWKKMSGNLPYQRMSIWISNDRILYLWQSYITVIGWQDCCKLWNQSKLLEHYAYFGISIITVASPQAIHGFIRICYGFFKTASLSLKILM